MKTILENGSFSFTCCNSFKLPFVYCRRGFMTLHLWRKQSNNFNDFSNICCVIAFHWLNWSMVIAQHTHNTDKPIHYSQTTMMIQGIINYEEIKYNLDSGLQVINVLLSSRRCSNDIIIIIKNVIISLDILIWSRDKLLMVSLIFYRGFSFDILRKSMVIIIMI